jgi:acylphosphatase
MAVRRHVIASGTVQGVWFRETCSRRARAAGVGGWIRNRPDGSVEAVFEGEAEAVDDLVSWCRRGPDRAVVTGVEVRDEPPEGEALFHAY